MLIAGKPTIHKPLETSRTRLSEHVWLTTYDDGSTSEDISWAGCVNTKKKVDIRHHVMQNRVVAMA